MKSIVIYKSVHHLNTEKVAKAIADELGAKLVKSEEVDLNSLEEYDLIGFGSGIYKGKHHRGLLELARNLPSLNKAAFVFSTCGVWRENYHKELSEILAQKGFMIKAEFTCDGWDTWGPLKLIGGLKKGHPDVKDLENARNFAKSLID